MMKPIFFLLLITLSHMVSAQHKCASQDLYNKHLLNDANFRAIHQQSEDNYLRQVSLLADQNPKINNSTAHKTNSVIVIPVVVHVVYNTPTQNISEAQIREQIRVLNEDYRLKNSDSLPSSHPFWPFTADAAYEFCLATTDPNGDPTNGITRTFTTTTGYAYDSNAVDVKFTSTGGHDNWNPNQYLNIWVCNLIKGTLGFATFPDELAIDPEVDGVVIGYKYFGTGGTTVFPFVKGRTTTHEVGHWLGLYHPCESSCDDDLVSDTAPCEELNFGCPSFPHNPNNTCGANANGEMYMNFMDYVDDACMNMFTYGQTVRMQNLQASLRPGISTANKCISTASIHDATDIKFSMYPNPCSSALEIYFGSAQLFDKPVIRICNTMGMELFRRTFENASSLMLDISHLANGTYFIQIEDQKKHSTKQLIILH